MKSKKVIGLLILVIVIAVIVVISAGVISDRKGPSIKIPSELVYSDNITEDDLLKGVTAYDSKDGDVSDTLIVENIIILDNKTQVKVTYAAKDSNNNVTEKSVVIPYKEHTAENETTPSETQTSVDNPTELSTEVEATTESIPEETTQVPTESAEAPVLTLTTYETEIVKGSEVNWLKYVSDITDDKDSRNDLFKRIMINDYADVNTPGEYQMKYKCSDSDGNFSPVVILKVHIIEN